MSVTKEDLLPLGFNFGGRPFCNVSKSEIDPTRMDYIFEGRPFYVHPAAGGEPPVVVLTGQWFMLF